MTYDAGIAANYSGRSAFHLYLYVRRDQTDVANNRSSYAWALYARNPNYSKQTYALDCWGWGVNIGGQGFSGCHSLDFRGGQYEILLGSGTTGWFGHNSDGYLNLAIDAYHSTNSVFGTADPAAAWFYTDRIAQRPAAPPRPALIKADTTSIEYQFFNSSNNGGSAETTFHHQVSRNSGFSDIAAAFADPSSPALVTGLAPGSSYWIRYLSQNGVGQSGWSESLKVDTLPATAPALTVVPTLTGAGSTVTVVPPQGTASVTKYTVERRLAGTTTPVTSAETTTGQLTVSGLTPGKTYEYRASAWYGTYQSPWTGWVSRTQPNPSTSPGDYFDGSTAATDDQTFSWVGAANNSMSRANGVAPLGWQIGGYDSGGNAILQRVHGGVSGTYAALMTVLTPATGAGIRVGIDRGANYRTAVQPRSTYFGSIHVRPSRAQRLAAEITWMNATGADIARTVSEPVVAPNDRYTRLIASGPAPNDAAFAVVRAVDAAGTGHVPWKAGETLLLDAAMLTMGDLYPYFDGSTPADSAHEYSWTGAANLSTSIREEVPELNPNLLVDPDCPPIPLPPAPPAIESGCIDEIGIWRRYWVLVPANEVRAWKTMVTTMELRTHLFPARQVRIRVRPNPFDYAPDMLDEGDWCSEQIVSYMPANTMLTLDGLMERVWAEVDGSQVVAADHLLYGTGGVPATWPELSCGIGYAISLDVPLDAPESNLDIGVSLTPRG